MATSDDMPAIRFERWPWQTSPGLAARFAAALVAVFILFAPYLANVSRDYTRYCYFWRTSDTLLLGVLVLGIAVLATLAGEAIRCSGRTWLVRLFNHLFLAALGVGLLTVLAFVAPKIPHVHWRLTTPQLQTGWIAIALMVGYSLGRPQSSIIAKIRQLCQILVPVVPVTFLALLWRSTYAVDIEPIVPIPQACAANHPSSTGGHNGGVYVFLFDEWSYERTFRNEAVLPKYPHLAEFTRSATIYHDARSPGECTEESIPGILLQTGDPVEVHDGRVGFRSTGGKVASSRDYTSLFRRIGALNYHTAMVGSSLPYRLWLGDQVDLCRNYCAYARAREWQSELGLHVFNAMHYSPDPWSTHAYKNLEQRILHAVTCDLLGNVRGDVHTIIREWPTNTFLFAHLLIPHSPVVLNPDLSVRTVAQTGWAEGDLPQYEANLAAMDAVLGDLLTALKQAGKYDEAVIVLTADHSWRSDPDWATGRLTGRKDHVPLVVKAARQAESAEVKTRFETRHVGALIESLVHPPVMRDVLFTANHAR